MLLVENVADQNTLATMRKALADWVKQSKSVTQHNAIYDLESDHGAERPRLRRVKHPHLRHPVFNAFARSESLVGILQQLLGPNVRMHRSKLNVKAVDHVFAVHGFASEREWVRSLNIIFVE